MYGGVAKTRGRKMKDSLAMLLKTNGGKMSVYGLLAMLMKTNWLHLLSRDVDGNEGDIGSLGAAYGRGSAGASERLGLMASHKAPPSTQSPAAVRKEVVQP